MVRNVWTQGTIAWYVTSAHRPADAHCHPIISCFITIQTGVPFLVPDQPGSPGKEAIKRVSKSDILRRRRTDTGVWPFCPRSLCVVASRPRLGPAIDAATTEPPQSHIEDFFFLGGVDWTWVSSIRPQRGPGADLLMGLGHEAPTNLGCGWNPRKLNFSVQLTLDTASKVLNLIHFGLVVGHVLREREGEVGHLVNPNEFVANVAALCFSFPHMPCPCSPMVKPLGRHVQ